MNIVQEGKESVTDWEVSNKHTTTPRRDSNLLSPTGEGADTADSIHQ